MNLSRIVQWGIDVLTTIAIIWFIWICFSEEPSRIDLRKEIETSINETVSSDSEVKTTNKIEPEYTSVDKTGSIKYYNIPLNSELQDVVKHYIKHMNIDIDETYIYALIYQESNFDSKATGYNGDSGYCQILQIYFEEIFNGLNTEFPQLVESEKLINDIYDEKTNLACGIYWLNKCAQGVTGKPLSNNNISASLTAYNRGVGGATKYFRENNTYITSYSQAIIDIAKVIQLNQGLPKNYRN